MREEREERDPAERTRGKLAGARIGRSTAVGAGGAPVGGGVEVVVGAGSTATGTASPDRAAADSGAAASLVVRSPGPLRSRRTGESS